MIYNVTYFNGLNSKANEARVFIRKQSWLIEFCDIHGNIIHDYWLPQLITPVELSGSVVTLTYGSFPPATLECRDERILQELEVYNIKKSVAGKLFTYIKNKGTKAVVSLAAALVFLVSIIYFVLLPFVAEMMAGAMPAAYEERLGYYIAQRFLEYEEINYELSDAVNEFSQSINYDLEIEPHIYVVESNIVNAYALPGGKIVIYDELLKKMNNESQLAALLCHEVAHVKYRHSLKAMFRNLGGYLFISWLFTDLNAVTAIIIENAHSLHTLSYSRSLEEEADFKALEMLASNNISQKGMVDLFHILKEEETVDLSEMSFLSTHPLTDDRITYSSKQASVQMKVENNPNLEQKFENIKLLLFPPKQLKITPGEYNGVE